MGASQSAGRTSAGGRENNRIITWEWPLAAPTIIKHMKLSEDNKANLAILALITAFLVLLFVMNA